MRIFVLGSGGMAGHVIAQYLEEQEFDVYRVAGREDLDVTDKYNLADLVRYYAPNVIVNCIGVLIGEADKDKSRTTYLNSHLPHYLSQGQAKVIHLSTDCVFSGEDGPYKEDSHKNAKDFYGQSKALGELDNDKDLTFRMSIIGPELKDGSGLFNWFMKQTECDGYTNAIWNGITTIELAKGVKAAIEQNLTGLYHLVPDESISKYDLLKLIDLNFKKGIKVNPTNGGLNDKSLVNTRSDFEYKVPGYEIMIEEMKDWIVNHKELYGRYL